MGLPAQGNAAASLVGGQIYHKSNLESITPFEYNREKTRKKSDIYAVHLSIVPSAVKALHKKQDWKLNIPVDADHKVSVLLYPVDIQAPGYYLENSKGDRLKGNRKTFYRGVVSDDPSSIVTAVVIGDQFSMMIADGQGNYNIGLQDDGQSYVFFNDQELGPMPFECQADEIDRIPGLPQGVQIKESTEKAGECVKVYIEIDNQSYINFGRNVATAEAFITNAFAQVATVYDNSNIPLQISAVKVWTTDDPYGAESNVSTALTYLARNISSFNGDLFHLVSARNTNSYSGIAYISCRGSGPCKATTIGTGSTFGVSQTSLSFNNYPTYSWTVNVLAHEMGHNMGAPHTHECAWGPNSNTAIDGCITPSGCPDPGRPSLGQGTIMSYCHFYSSVGVSLSVGFGNEVGTHLYNEFQYVKPRYLSPCGIVEVPIAGCMNPADHNYNDLATVNDGSCAGTCADGIQNGDETGVDCGGSQCSSCSEPVCPTSLALSASLVEGFESSLAAWSQATDDNLDWTQNSGSTPSSGTGPSAAAQGQYYFYIEASAPNYPSKSAVLKSACLNTSALASPTLSFNYNMYGSTMGSLEVRSVNANSGASTQLFFISGNQGNVWNEASIDLSFLKNITYSIEIIGTTGSGFASDIAIDELAISGESSTCSDGVKNGTETGIDCGGPSCSPCAACTDVDLTIRSSQSLTGNQNNIVQNTITANAPVTIMANANVLWQAGNGISINSTFEVKAGAQLILSADSCNDQ